MCVVENLKTEISREKLQIAHRPPSAGSWDLFYDLSGLVLYSLGFSKRVMNEAVFRWCQPVVLVVMRDERALSMP